MSLPTARGDSNAPDLKGAHEPSTGEIAMVGFTHVPYEKFRPAQDNTQIPSTTDSIGGGVLGQDGTSVQAYHFQPDTVSLNDEGKELSVASKNQEE